MTDQRNKHDAVDAVVVGSGCTGGTAAMVLARAGLKVLVLEAGPQRTPESATPTPSAPRDVLTRFWRGFVSRRQVHQSAHPAFWYHNPSYFVDDRDHPYETPPDRPFLWIRGRQVGGRSLTWGGMVARWSSYEFETPRRDGYGDWPLGYADLESHYAGLERVCGVRGNPYGLAGFPDGEFAQGCSFTPAEERFKRRLEARWPERRLVMSRGLVHEPDEDRGPWPARSSLATTLAAAMRTGRVTLRPGAIVRRISFRPDSGRADGVLAVDAGSGETLRFAARIVVLCASTVESVRILLASAGRAHPDGPGNRGGLLGRGLMDHITASRHFFFPYDGDDLRTVHPIGGSRTVVIPRWCNLDRRDREFAGGFGVWGGIQRDYRPQTRPGWVGGMLQATAEMMPDPDNRIELSTDRTDPWGIPLARIHCRWGENDQRLKRHIEQVLDEILEGTGSVPRPPALALPLISSVVGRIERSQNVPGFCIHEVGGARMGHSDQTSVVNGYCQVWGAPNLLVTDGACWPTQGWQSPTLTMMAITSRACDRAVEELSRGDL